MIILKINFEGRCIKVLNFVFSKQFILYLLLLGLGISLKHLSRFLIILFFVLKNKREMIYPCHYFRDREHKRNITELLRQKKISSNPDE